MNVEEEVLEDLEEYNSDSICQYLVTRLKKMRMMDMLCLIHRPLDMGGKLEQLLDWTCKTRRYNCTKDFIADQETLYTV